MNTRATSRKKIQIPKKLKYWSRKSTLSISSNRLNPIRYTGMNLFIRIVLSNAPNSKTSNESIAAIGMISVQLLESRRKVFLVFTSAGGSGIGGSSTGGSLTGGVTGEAGSGTGSCAGAASLSISSIISLSVSIKISLSKKFRLLYHFLISTEIITYNFPDSRKNPAFSQYAQAGVNHTNRQHFCLVL